MGTRAWVPGLVMAMIAAASASAAGAQRLTIGDAQGPLAAGSMVAMEMDLDCARRYFRVEVVTNGRGSDALRATEQFASGGCNGLKAPLPTLRLRQGGELRVQFTPTMFVEPSWNERYECNYAFHKASVSLESGTLQTRPEQFAEGKFSARHSETNNPEDCSHAPFEAPFAVSVYEAEAPFSPLSVSATP